MSTTIFFIRHGHVENPNQLHYGRLPGFGLSLLGRQEIKETAQQLSHYPIVALFSSPLARARESAVIIGKHIGHSPIVDDRLIEVAFYQQGQPRKEFEKIEHVLYCQNMLEKGQESIESIQNRMNEFINMVLENYNGQTVAAVSHGDPIGIIKAYFDGKEYTIDYKRRSMILPGSFITITV